MRFDDRRKELSEEMRMMRMMMVMMINDSVEDHSGVETEWKFYHEMIELESQLHCYIWKFHGNCFVFSLF